jgi:hypothetical protein
MQPLRARVKAAFRAHRTNIMRRELGLPEAYLRAADPKLYFANIDQR